MADLMQAPTVAPPTGGHRRIVVRSQRRSWVFLMAVPALLGMLAVLFYPSVTGIARAFTDWFPGADSTSWIGLENFRSLLDDSAFQQVMVNLLVYILGAPLWTFGPLVIALLLQERVPAASLFRALIFFPAVLSPAIVSILFLAILEPDGLVNSTLRSLGLERLALDWIDDPSLVKWTLLLVILWATCGVGVLIYSAALSAVPPDLFEAAELDGAGWWSRLVNVAIPGIRSTIWAYFTLNVATVFLFMFTWVYVLTEGGPGYASSTLDYDVFQRAFSFQEWGQASAEALILLSCLCLAMLLVVLGRTVMGWLPRHAVRTALEPATERLRRTERRIALARAGRRSRRRDSWSPVRTLLAAVVVVPFVLPFVYLSGLAVRTDDDYNAAPERLLPQSFTLEHFVQAWTEGDLGRAMVNSVIAVGIGAITACILALLVSYWLLFASPIGRRVVYSASFMAFSLPGVLWLLPLFVTLANLDLTDNLLVLGLVYAITQTAFAIGVIASYTREGVAMELLEAASVDGAGTRQKFLRIFVPLARPAIGAQLALSALFLWGDLLVGLVLIQSPERFPAILAATSFATRTDPAIQVTAAANLIIIVPVLILFIVAQRAIVRGYTAGIGRV